MIVDDLSRIAMASNLAGSLSRATDYARAQGHAEVTLEHMLLALCDDPDAVLVMAASNVNVAELMREVGGQLSALPTRGVHGQGVELIVSPDLRRILEAAAAAARGGRRREINGAIVLAAIIGDGKSPSAHVLRNLGLTFEGAIRALQRVAPAPQPPAPDAEAILADARERVQSRTGPPMRRPPVNGGQLHEEVAAEPAATLPAEASEEDMAASPPARAKPVAQPAPEPESEAVFGPEPSSAPPPEVNPEPHYESESVFERDALFAIRSRVREPDFEPQPGFGHQPELPGGEALTSADPHAPPPMPASAPFPPPIPVPDAQVGWTPPPSPPPPAMPPRPPLRAPPPPPFAPPAPAAAHPRPGPPPLAPWPDQRARPEGVGAGSSDRPSAYDAMVPDNRFRLGRKPAPQMAPQAPNQPSGRPAPVGRAEIGQLVENIPRNMRVAVATLIEVRVARANVQALAEGLQGGGAAYQHEVMVTKAMSVRLRAPDGGFFIETASPETQWIDKAMPLSSDDFASWRWHVTPREKGRRRLQLIISARTVSADGLAAETALPDQVITVRVKTNYAKVARHWIGWGVAALLGGLLAKFGEGAFNAVTKLITG